MTILDCCISLKVIKKFLVVLGVVDMRQLLLKVDKKYFDIPLNHCAMAPFGYNRHNKQSI